MNYRLLDWDTEFFEFKVACIDDEDLSDKGLSQTLSTLKEEKVQLVYWPAEHECGDAVREDFCGLLVDRKTTFHINLQTLDTDQFIPTDRVTSYAPSLDRNQLEDLAILAGEHSRFAVDPGVPREKFTSLYKTWINQSCARESASEILVVLDSDQIAGMVTLGEKDGRGDIGLIAVGRPFQGKRYGEMLVRAAQRSLIVHGYTIGQVVTQGTNLPAQSLYKKCGYSEESVSYFYHFWL